MAATIYRDDTIRITVVFRDYLGDPVDPDTVVVEIFNAPLAATPSALISGVGTNTAVGTYIYDWTPDTVGDFVVRFTGTFSDSSTDVINQEFTVILNTTTVTPETVLGIDYVLEFASGLTPLYVAPEELVEMFPDATLLDAAEAIHRASLEVKELLSLSDDEVPVWVGLDYVIAAASCHLSRVFDISSGDALSIRLGDLSVTNRSYPKNSVNRGNATTPCELAAALRKELLMKTTKAKATVRGSDYPNPIPNRKFRDYDKSPDTTVWYQGRLDDNDGLA